MNWILWTGRINLLLLWVAASSGHAATLSVGEGLEYETLSAAISNAATGDVLLVAPGVYDTTRGETFPLIPKAAITLRASDPGARPVIRGDGFTSHFIFDEIDAATLEGLEMYHAAASSVRIDSTTTAIIHSIIRDSRGSPGGGAIWAEDSRLDLIRSEITGNRSTRRGMAIRGTRCRLNIVECSIDGNPPENYLSGDIVYLEDCAELNLRKSTFEENRGIGEGVIVSMENLHEATGAVLIEDCTFAGNGFVGGSVFFMVGCDAEVRRTRFSNNTNTNFNFDSAIRGDRSKLRVFESEISHNEGMGGIRIWDGTLTIEDSVVSNNGGGGVHALFLTMKDTLVNGNGLIGVRANSFEIEDSEIIENEYAGLGPLSVQEVPPKFSTISNTLINRNGLADREYPSGFEFQYVAGVYLIRPAHFKNCEISGNRWDDKSLGGVGGLEIGANVLFEDCLIEDNSSDRGTAGFHVARGESVFSRCRILGNRAEPEQAGDPRGNITLSPETSVIFLNSILAGNISGSAPLIDVPNLFDRVRPRVDFLNCTIEGNQDPFSGLSRIVDADDVNVHIVNSIIWNGPNSIDGASLDVSHSNIQDGVHPGPGNISEDPLFFQAWDGTTADYRLPCHSPSVDSGTSTGAPSVDIAGSHRPRGLGYDMGAYENCAFDINGDGEMNGKDYLTFMQEWMEPVTVDNKPFDFVTGPSSPNRVDESDLLEILRHNE